MSIQRFFVNPGQTDLTGPTVRLCEPGLINQAKNVLRLKPPDRIILLDGCGYLYNCRIIAIDNQAVQLEVVNKAAASGEPSICVCVAMPLIKGGRFEWALEKLTELGVSVILPTLTERAVVRLSTAAGDKDKESADKVHKKLHHWQEILREAAEQCERAAIPQIVEPVELQDLLADNRRLEQLGVSAKLICAERKSAPNIERIAHTLDIRHLPPPGVCVVIGPEGGLTDGELSTAAANGWQPVSLGSRILRAETAAIYALAQIISVADN